MKIAVYSIARNELREVAGWEEATRDADFRLVYDTGSTDGTDVELAKFDTVHLARGCIRPWRFDDARNAALALIPEDIDICISLDMDERMHGADCPIGIGWYEAIQRTWTAKTTMLRCLMTSGGRAYHSYRIHSRFGWRWKNPIHEILQWRGYSDFLDTLTDALTIEHLPDVGKPRPAHEDMLYEAVTEAPTDYRMALQYGWQLAVDGKTESGMAELRRYLHLAPKVGIEAAFVHRLLAAYDHPDRFVEHITHADEAYPSSSNMIVLAEYYEKREMWPACYTACQAAIARERMRPNEIGHWGDDIRRISPWLHDIASSSAYNCWDFEAAYGHAVEAYRRDPNAKRKEIMLAIQKHIADGATMENMLKPPRQAGAEIVHGNFAKTA